MTEHERGIEAAVAAYYARERSAIANDDISSGVEAAISAYLAAEPGKPESGGWAEVKTLIWEVYNIDMHKAETFFGYYVVAASGHCWLNAGPLAKDFESIGKNVDAAKGFCQADYERRIMSALSTPPQPVEEGEPVAWMFEGKGWGREVMLSEREALERKERLSRTWDITITPLYSTPAPSLGVDIETLQRRVEELEAAASFQSRVADAHHALFHDDPTDVPERMARFFEEANETCQAFGMTREEAHQLVDYTYSRPAGEPKKEIGAAYLTLTSLCVEAGIDAMECAEADLAKLVRPETIERIRAKRATRHGRGPLPGFDPAAPKPFTFADPNAQLQHERHRAESNRREGE